MGSQYYCLGKSQGAANDPPGNALPAQGHACVVPRPLIVSETLSLLTWPAAHHSSILTGSTVTEFKCPTVGRAETLSRNNCGDKGRMLLACMCLDLPLSKHGAGLLPWEGD